MQEISQCELTAPHTEDVRLVRKSQEKTLSTNKLKDRILRITDAPLVPAERDILWISSVQLIRKRGRIIPKHGVPVFSTGFGASRKLYIGDKMITAAHDTYIAMVTTAVVVTTRRCPSMSNTSDAPNQSTRFRPVLFYASHCLISLETDLATTLRLVSVGKFNWPRLRFRN